MCILISSISATYNFLIIFAITLIFSSNSSQIVITNNCSYTVWAAANPGGGKRLSPGDTWTIPNLPRGNGRIWGRTNCSGFDTDGRGGRCESGDCGGVLECITNGRAPNTIVEYTIGTANSTDEFQISVTEGFNIPIQFGSDKCNKSTQCEGDRINAACPMELRGPGGCNSPCTVFQNDQFCCNIRPQNPNSVFTSAIFGNDCGPTSYSKIFETHCPLAMTYPNDAAKAHRCKTGIEYNTVFCPGRRGIISSLFSASNFDEFLKNRDDMTCPGRGFYNYDAFLTAASSFVGFCTTGNITTRQRELVAFFGQTAFVTNGGPDEEFTWGYCYVRAADQQNNCSSTPEWPCASGQKYYGRGPIQLTFNYNYGKSGQALGLDLINNPDLVATDAVISFKTAIWYWMTPQGNNPSCHDVITGQWRPSDSDLSARRVPGYGLITNIINGQCGDHDSTGRIGFYKRFCDIIGVTYGDNLNCSQITL